MQTQNDYTSNTIYEEPRFRIYGDQGILMEFGDVISPEIHTMVRSISYELGKKLPDGVREYVPSYRSIALLYDPLVTDFDLLRQNLKAIYDGCDSNELPPPREVEIPVCYGGEYGPDIGFVAKHNNISVKEVIRLHSESAYLVYMLGFTPGFPFLGGLSEKLHTPRLESPRKKVVAGSVGIANGQTGVYPIDSPGGWQLIGRVPIKLFDAEKKDPFLLQCGDLLKFKPVSEEEYRELAV